MAQFQSNVIWMQIRAGHVIAVLSAKTPTSLIPLPVFCVFVFVCLCICLGHGSWVLDMGGQNTYWNFFYCQRFPQPGWLAINSMSSSLADCSLDSSSGMGSMLGWFETGVGSNGPLRMIGWVGVEWKMGRQGGVGRRTLLLGGRKSSSSAQQGWEGGLLGGWSEFIWTGG